MLERTHHACNVKRNTRKIGEEGILRRLGNIVANGIVPILKSEDDIPGRQKVCHFLFDLCRNAAKIVEIKLVVVAAFILTTIMKLEYGVGGSV